MAFKLFSDVRETSTTGGTGDQVLTGSAFDASYFRFDAKYGNGDTFFYCMKQGAAREIGLGTRVTAGDKIARSQVYRSTNSNALVNFTAGQTIDIFVTAIGSDDLDAAGRALLASSMGVPSTEADQSLTQTQKSKALSNVGGANLVTTNSFTEVTDAISSTSGGAFTIAGGLAVAKKLFVGGILNALSGIAGVTTNSNAAAGIVGEYISSTQAIGSPINVPSNVPSNATTISLTAGDWDVSGVVGAVGSGTLTRLAGYVTLTSNSFPAQPNSGAIFDSPGMNIAAPGTSSFVPNFATGTTRISLSSTTTVYLGGTAVFSGGAMGIFGFIGARRVR
jgi:hypothetical protein